jgi:hypothetical protein
MANSTINSFSPIIPTQLDNNAAYSVGDGGNVEKKSFLGQIWTSIKTLFASGRQSVAADNQQVLLALNDRLRAGGLDDSQAAGFIGQIDNAVGAGKRAITGGDIKGILQQAQGQMDQVQSARHLFRTVMGDIAGNPEGHLHSDPAAILSRDSLNCSESETMAISLMRHMPSDRALSTVESHRLGQSIAERLTGAGLASLEGEVSDLADRYLEEMSSSGFINLCQDFADGLISPRNVDLSGSGARSTVADNISAVLTETRQALMTLKATGGTNMAQGGSPDDIGMAATGLAPLADRAEHVLGLLDGERDSFLADSNLELRGNPRNLIGSYLSSISASDIGGITGFIRGNSPGESNFRILAGTTITPYINDLMNMGSQQVTLSDGQSYSLVDLAQNYKEMEPPEIRQEAKTDILQNLSTMINSNPQALNSMREMLTRLKSDMEAALRSAYPNIDQRTLDSRIRDSVTTILLGQSGAIVKTLADTGAESASNLYTLAFSNVLSPGLTNADPEVMDFVSSLFQAQ